MDGHEDCMRCARTIYPFECPGYTPWLLANVTDSMSTWSSKVDLTNAARKDRKGSTLR